MYTGNQVVRPGGNEAWGLVRERNIFVNDLVIPVLAGGRKGMSLQVFQV
jgi:hypothetical protein